LTHSDGDYARDELLEIAKQDPGKLYDEAYYNEGYEEATSAPYGRHEPWLSFFSNIADEIVGKFQPTTFADIGCAYGLLVEALVDRGVDAFGYDCSPYAISKGRSDVRNRLAVHNILDEIPLNTGKKYDLVTCIEVLEHIPADQVDQAIKNLCDSSNRILFSSSPDDFEESTHFSVLPTKTWLKKFEKHGFYSTSKSYRANYVAPQARVVEKRPKPMTFTSSWIASRLG